MLRDPDVLRQLGVTKADLIRTSGNKYQVTHAIGDWAKAEGYSGIIAPSARFDGRANLISFEDL
ncbi:MAG: RES family NAD+ phosphorylase [Planctomycetaceae bacterium]|nr:RES family NAD+ phosphorylase [Planctomycetaceae bacterium]